MTIPTASANGQGSVPAVIPMKADGTTQLEQRVTYVKRHHGNMWYVTFDKCGDRETFACMEAGESGKWYEFTPCEKERLAARELLARQTVVRQWEATLSLDELAVNCISNLGEFPACIGQAVHELKRLSLDARNQDQLSLAAEICDHATAADQVVRDVYAWISRHRDLRRRAEGYGMIS